SFSILFFRLKYRHVRKVVSKRKRKKKKSRALRITLESEEKMVSESFIVPFSQYDTWVIFTEYGYPTLKQEGFRCKSNAEKWLDGSSSQPKVSMACGGIISSPRFEAGLKKLSVSR
ncbi:MAG: hypothetical protein D3910_17585, partial [Candidatus Electrothrix sp. ATG2]|nr:hypothetical protein [Candidatus Electrothrix sp. ATG2]